MILILMSYFGGAVVGEVQHRLNLSLKVYLLHFVKRQTVRRWYGTSETSRILKRPIILMLRHPRIETSHHTTSRLQMLSIAAFDQDLPQSMPGNTVRLCYTAKETK